MTYDAQNTRYDSMIYRRTGRSGLLLPVISLGMWYNFGGVDSIPKRSQDGSLCLRSLDHTFDRLTIMDLAGSARTFLANCQTGFRPISR